MTGFLLTAIPNWTGRFPLQGRPLLALFVLWLAGRAAMLAVDEIGTIAAAIVDCAYLVTLTAVITREIVAGSNWRNLRVGALVALTAIANLVFQAEVVIYAAPTYGLRLAVAAIVGLIMVVGGRITPSFTSNWLTRQGIGKRPAPLDRFDIASIAFAALALVAWIAAPDWYGTAALLLLMAIAQAARLSRWAGGQTWREPILFVLHVGYAFVPLGALMLSLSILWPRIVPASGALHAWTTGAMGIMTLAVMTRATLGHYADDNGNLWRNAAGYIGARRRAAGTRDLLRGIAGRRPRLALGLRYFPPDLRADAGGDETNLTDIPSGGLNVCFEG
jgi:uncharacterized protein involved in response to NO